MHVVVKVENAGCQFPVTLTRRSQFHEIVNFTNGGRNNCYSYCDLHLPAGKQLMKQNNYCSSLLSN